MYGQLYHRTISRELREPRRSPRGGAVGRGGGCEGMGSARAAGQRGRDGRGPRMRQASWACRCAKPVRLDCRAQSPFGRTAGRCRGKAGRRWQHLRAMHDFGPLDAKRPLGGKIRAPCILNRPIAPGNECIGRRCCHLDLEKHAFRADVARKRAHFAHSAKWGCIRRDSCQPGPRGRRNARGGREWRRMVDAVHPHRRQLFAQAGKHCRNAFL